MSSGVGVLEPGTVFARDFRVVRGLRTGGMGAVYVVDQMSTGKQRALKIMAPELAMDPATRERFVLEARAASRIESDHVVEIVTAGVDESTGAPYLVMELLRGEELADALERTGRLSLGDVAEVLAQVGHALEQAHAHGIVHRDLKPENIFLAASKRRDASFTAKVLDFGIAKLVADSVQKTGTQPLGTPLFMSPEQTDRKGRISPATDVWALGLIAFKLLTGRDFWLEADGSLPMLLREIVIEPIPYASARARQFGVEALLPPGFDGWFVRCVNVDINARFPEAGAAVRAFAEIVAPDTQRGQLILAGGANLGSQPLAGQSGALAGPGSPAMGGFNTGPGAHPAGVSVGAVTYPQPSSTGAPIAPYAGGPPGAMYPSGPPAYGVSPQSSTTSPASLSRPTGNLAGGAPPSSKAWLAIPLVLVLGGALAFGGYKLLGPGAAPAGSTQAGPGPSGAAVARATGATPESSARPAAGTGTTCPDGLAFIKGGKMFMGARDLSDDANPPHSVTVSSFCIDKKEVTTAEYDACFEKTECERPLENVSWPNISAAQKQRYSPLCNGMKKDRDAHPINCVAWSMADNFCKKRGARLPTEAEWEYAARGSRQRTYPWGDEAPGAKHLNACGKECAKWGADNKDAKTTTMHGEDDGHATTAPAGSFPAGATAEGVLDLAGNVWEWTADWHAPYPATEGMVDPKGAETGTKRVARGGDFTSSNPDWAKPAWRWKTEPDTYNHAIGFRCAMEPRP